MTNSPQSFRLFPRKFADVISSSEYKISSAKYDKKKSHVCSWKQIARGDKRPEDILTKIFFFQERLKRKMKSQKKKRSEAVEAKV